MMEYDGWRSIGRELGISVLSPITLFLEGTPATFTALVHHFGGEKGMVVDPDWRVLEPYIHALGQEGYGYSCVSIAGELNGPAKLSLQEMLQEWGWAGLVEDRPDWA